MKCKWFSLCDNAVNTHYVPSDYLAQYDESFIIGGDRFLGTAAEKGGSTNKISQDSSNKIIDLEQHENPPNTRLRIPQKPNEFHFPTNEASITLPKTRKSSLDLIGKKYYNKIRKKYCKPISRSR